MASRATPSTTANDDPPFGALLVRYMSPFWLFQDASRGDRLARAAAYRHNRSMRIHLPTYLMRWMSTSALALALTAACDSVALDIASHESPPLNVFLLLAVGGGIAFAGSVCMFALIGYIYLYLGKHED